ncbi:MAG TPA: hypothetical protein GXX29_03485 [Firmicutes bacterium]|nr:hypothetical protein [Bacillota bacterium]
MAELTAGAAVVDITPWLGISIAGLFNDRKAIDVNDPLHAKALVLKNEGEDPLVLLLLDLLAVTNEDAAAIKKRLQEQAGIPPERVLVAATHTHTGPTTQDIYGCKREEEYCRFMVTRAADCVRLALRRLRPAKLSWGRGQVTGVTYCRRYLMKNGMVRTNPGRGNPDVVRPVSPIDPDLGVLYVTERDSDTPIALVAQFALHYVGTDDARTISADYYAHFARQVGLFTGPECVVMLFNSTSGQINNVDITDPKQEDGHAQARKVAGMLAGEVQKVINHLALSKKATGDCLLKADCRQVMLPRKKITAADLELAREILSGRYKGAAERPLFSWEISPVSPSILKYFAEDAFFLAELPEELAAPVQVLRIGDSAWVGLPGEIFVEIGLTIKKDSPLADTFVIGLANGNMGYIATNKAYLEEGGYETFASRWSKVGPGSEGILCRTALEMLGRL